MIKVLNILILLMWYHWIFQKTAQDQADHTIKNEDPLEDPLEINDEEKPLFTYGDLFYPTFYPKKRWYWKPDQNPLISLFNTK